MNALVIAIETVLPVVLLLAIGRLYARSKGFSAELTRGAGSLVFWVCLPALTFREILHADAGRLFDLRLCGVLVACIVICAFVGYRYARAIGAPENKVGVIAQGSFRSNMMYVGLPVLLSFAESHARAIKISGAPPDASGYERVAQLTAIGAAVSIPLLNAASIMVFELAGRKRPGKSFSVLKIASGILLNPLIVAVACAVLAPFIPGAKELFNSDRVPGRTLDMTAAAALPLALFTIGANLSLKRAMAGLRETLPVAFVKLFLMPALGFALLYALNVTGAPLAVGIVLLACPDAATGHAMASEFGGDEVLAGELVAITTLLCPFSLVLWLSLVSILG